MEKYLKDPYKDDRSFKAFQIIGDNFETMVPQPKQRAVAVTDFKNANFAFKYINIDFVYALNEEKSSN